MIDTQSLDNMNSCYGYSWGSVDDVTVVDGDIIDFDSAVFFVL